MGVCGDIKEMFHQVLVQRDDRCAQRFLWRNDDATRQPDVYEMRVMTFGAACSPCAANYVKTINALEYCNKVSGAARAVKSILGKPKALQLHVFVDASEDAFAAVAYWRSTNAAGEVEVTFISAKTKCAPMKSLTVPRLELQAAVLGTRLMSCVREEHSLHIDDCTIWSDSKTVIQWLRSEHRRYKPFVQHRIAEILAATTTANWRWLPTEYNVADEATRTNNSVDFSSSARWSCGPSFLSREVQTWPTECSTYNHPEEADKELRPKFAFAIVSCSLLVRTTAWVLGFVDICRRRNPPDRCYGLTTKDVETAKPCLCRLVQRGEYAEEFQQIESGHDLPRTSSLIQLSPYIDEDGVLRVRGRIDAASWLPISSRRPIILPPKHYFTWSFEPG